MTFSLDETHRLHDTDGDPVSLVSLLGLPHVLGLHTVRLPVRLGVQTRPSVPSRPLPHDFRVDFIPTLSPGLSPTSRCCPVPPPQTVLGGVRVEDVQRRDNCPGNRRRLQRRDNCSGNRRRRPSVGPAGPRRLLSIRRVRSGGSRKETLENKLVFPS